MKKVIKMMTKLEAEEIVDKLQMRGWKHPKIECRGNDIYNVVATEPTKQRLWILDEYREDIDSLCN